MMSVKKEIGGVKRERPQPNVDDDAALYAAAAVADDVAAAGPVAAAGAGGAAAAQYDDPYVVATHSDAHVAGSPAATAALRPAKKAKHMAETNADGETFYVLSEKRRLTLRDFRGKKYVDIREYYEKDGKHLPGKKGIMLPADQMRVIFELQADLEQHLDG